MRKDMQKVIVESPRWGSRIKTHRRNRNGRDLDALPKQIGMRKHASTLPRGKEFSDHLRPLERFLRRHCGRAWDSVFSEICANSDTRSTMGAHLRDHVDQLVARALKVGADGKLHDPAYRRPGLRGRYWGELFYVDPRNGLLKDSRMQRRKDRRRQR